MSGLRRMLMNKKGGFYVRSVEVTALSQGPVKYTYYVDITFSRELSEDEGQISSVSAEVATGNSVMSETSTLGAVKKTGTFSPAGRVGGTTYRFPAFTDVKKYSYYRIKLTPMVGDTALEALPTLFGNVR